MHHAHLVLFLNKLTIFDKFKFRIDKCKPVTGVDESFSVEEEVTVVVTGFDKFLIVVCNSDRSCCKARLNLSSLSSLASNCRFSFSKSLNLNKKIK
jgi:hypothetical protein